MPDYPSQARMGVNHLVRTGRDHQVMLTVAERDEHDFVSTDRAVCRFQLRAGSKLEPLIYRQIAQAVAAWRDGMPPHDDEACMHQPDTVDAGSGVQAMQAERASDEACRCVAKPQRAQLPLVRHGWP